MNRSLLTLLAVAVLVVPLAAQADQRHGGPGHDNRRPQHVERHYLTYPDRECWVEPVRHGNTVRKEIRCLHPSYGPPGWAAVPHRYVTRQPTQLVVVPTAPPPGPSYGEVYQDKGGRYCREYNTMAEIGGRQERLYGTACMMPDGSWQFDG